MRLLSLLEQKHLAGRRNQLTHGRRGFRAPMGIVADAAETGPGHFLPINRRINITVADREAQLKARDIMFGNVIGDPSKVAKFTKEGEWETSGIRAYASDLKHATVSMLDKNSPMTYEEANQFVAQWTITSNDHSHRSLSLQASAAQEFGVPLSSFQKDRMAAVHAQQAKIGTGNTIPFGSPLEQATLRTMYEATQARFAEAGITHVTLYRGFGAPAHGIASGGAYEVEHSALSSWTLSHRVAKSFAQADELVDRHVVKAVVLVSRILSCPSTGFGCLDELEFVVLGSKVPDLVTIY